MKKIFVPLMALCLSTFAFQGQLKAVSEPVTKQAQNTDAQKAEKLMQRLQEINSMDIRHMSAGKKKSLKAEVYNIRQDLNAIGGGIYISFAAILIIILLLILL
jgi:DNA-binding transcriptional regulator WhiA